MGDERYRVRWKGRVLGRFTRREVAEKLAAREWSLHHEVESGEGWRSLEEFMAEAVGASGGEVKAGAPVDGWLVAGYGCVGLLAVTGVVLLAGGRWVEAEWIYLGSVALGLAGSVCGLLILSRGGWVHGLVLVGGSVGFALAVMAWMARH